MTRWHVFGCLLFLSLSTISCSYSMAPMGIVTSETVNKPIKWQQTVEASEWAFFGEIAVGKMMHTLRTKADVLGADDILDIRVKNNCYWSVVPAIGEVIRCWADGLGVAVKYEDAANPQ